jgi:hypothetical protein
VPAASANNWPPARALAFGTLSNSEPVASIITIRAPMGGGQAPALAASHGGSSANTDSSTAPASSPQHAKTRDARSVA